MNAINAVSVITYNIHHGEPHYLLLGSQAGTWDFPKEHMIPNETKQEAAYRIIHREMGLSVELDKKFEETLIYTFVPESKESAEEIVHMLIGHATSSAVTLPHQYTGFKWLSFEEARNELSNNDTKKLFKKAHDYILDELKKARH